MKKLLLWVFCLTLILLFNGCSSKEIFVESNEIKDFPIPEEAKLVETIHKESAYKYLYKGKELESGFSKTFYQKVEEYGWELSTQDDEGKVCYFKKNDRTLCLTLDKDGFILDEIENYPTKRDESGNYLLCYERLFDGDKNNIFFENALEENAYQWFMGLVEELKGENHKNYYTYRTKDNIYEYLIITGGRKIEKAYINNEKSKIIIEIIEGEEKEEIQVIRYKSYPTIPQRDIKILS